MTIRKTTITSYGSTRATTSGQKFLTGIHIRARIGKEPSILVVTPKESIRHSIFAYFALRIDVYGMTVRKSMLFP
jgi:hypothetical protein